MKKIFKWVLRGIAVLAVVVAIGAAWNWEKIVRLYNVNTLFDEANIVSNFSNMENLFYSTPLPRSGPVVGWKVEKVELPKTYIWRGKEKPVSDWLEETRTTSLLVVRDGNIVSEDYYLGTKPSDKRISWSMAKSVLSAAFGIAVSEGKIASLDDQVTKYVPALKDSAYNGVTIRNVLNMASGVHFNEDYLDFNSDINKMGRVLALGGSMDEFAIGIKKRDREPGSARKYVSIDTHVLSMVLRAATGKSLKEYFINKLWSKLGVAGNAIYLTDGYGVMFALGGLNMQTRDYARFGQLFMQNGEFEGKQLVPADWVKASVTNSAPAPATDDDPFGYGYQWWMPPNADGEYFAVGIYGQFIYINPKAKVLVVKTSAHRGFRNDGVKGRDIKLETIAMFRAIASQLSGWKIPE